MLTLTATAEQATSTPQLWTYFVGPAVIAAGVAGLFAVAQLALTSRKEQRKQLLEFRLRQVNEFYGPIVYLLAQNLAIAKALREAAQKPGQEWHLLDDLDTIHSDPHLRSMADEIAAINDQIKDVLLKYGGLSLQGQVPQSYHDFIAHTDLVAQGVSTGSIHSNVGVKYFPKQFGTDIEEAYGRQVKKIQDQLGSRRFWRNEKI